MVLVLVAGDGGANDDNVDGDGTGDDVHDDGNNNVNT